MSTDKQLREGIRQYEARLKELAKNTMAGTEPEAKQTYLDRGGTDYDAALAGTSPTSSQMDPQIQAYADQYKLPYAKAESILRKRGYNGQ